MCARAMEANSDATLEHDSGDEFEFEEDEEEEEAEEEHDSLSLRAVMM